MTAAVVIAKLSERIYFHRLCCYDYHFQSIDLLYIACVTGTVVDLPYLYRGNDPYRRAARWEDQRGYATRFQGTAGGLAVSLDDLKCICIFSLTACDVY